MNQNMEQWRKNKEEQARKLAMQKAIQHEQSFIRKSDSDIAKRMGSDLFKAYVMGEPYKGGNE